MMFLLFVFIVLGVIFYLIGSSKGVGTLLVSFLGLISLLTPFWPVVLVGVFAMFRISEKEERKSIEKKTQGYRTNGLTPEEQALVNEYKSRLGS